MTHGPRRFAGGGRVRWPSRTMVVIGALAFSFGTAQTLLRPLIAPFAAELGAGPLVVGLAVALQPLPGFFLAVPAGSLADTMGGRRMLIVGAVGFMMGGTLLAMAFGLPMLMLGQLVIGFGALGLPIAVQSVVTMPMEDGRLDTRRVAGFSTLTLVGHLVGPTLGGVLTDLGGYSAAFTAIAVLGGCVALLGLALPNEAAVADAEGAGAAGRREAVGLLGPYRRAGGLLADRAVAAILVASGLGVAMTSLRMSFLPLHLTGIGWSASQIGLLLSGASIAALVSRMAFPAAERRLAPRVLVFCSVVAGGVATAATVVSASAAVIIPAAALAGLMLGTTNPLTLTVLARLVAARRRGLAVGLRITANRFADWLGPLLFGGMAAVGSVRSAYIAFSLAAGAVGGLTSRHITEEQGRGQV